MKDECQMLEAANRMRFIGIGLRFGSVRFDLIFFYHLGNDGIGYSVYSSLF